VVIAFLGRNFVGRTNQTSPPLTSSTTFSQRSSSLKHMFMENTGKASDEHSREPLAVRQVRPFIPRLPWRPADRLPLAESNIFVQNPTQETQSQQSSVCVEWQ
jgi:hypothetical protein